MYDILTANSRLIILKNKPYAPHYNPRVFTPFFPAVFIEERFILQTIYVLKTEVLHFLSLKSGENFNESFQ